MISMVMAPRELVLCDTLCCLFTNLDKMELKPLKSVLLDYYQPSELSAAKTLLLEHAKLLEKSDSLPHIPACRREGGSTAIKDVDDMFTIVNFLDENKLRGSMPMFVTNNPNNIPSGRIFEGDLRFMIERLDKLDDTLKSTLTAILHEISQVRALCESKAVTSGHGYQQGKGVNNTPGNISTAHNIQMTASSQKVVNSAWGFSTTASQPTKETVVDQQTSTNWAAATSHLTVQSQEDTDGDTGDFTPSVNKKKRRRIQRAQQLQETNQLMQTGDSAAAKSTSNERYKPLLVGKKQTGNGDEHKLKAAKKIVPKAVFCVDNLDTAVTVSDITSFVSSIGVTVISCFSVQPRRSASQKLSHFKPANRNAFRLCVLRDDVDRLLDADVWPNDVTISKWFFKPKSDEQMDQYVEPSDEALRGNVHLSAVGGPLSGQLTSGTATGGEMSGTNYSGLTLQSFIQPGLLVVGNNGTASDDGETTILVDPEDDSNKNGV